MQAVILAGGKGRRLAPYSLVFPKPLMPIGEHPILAVLMQQLCHYGVDNVVLCLGHLGALIRSYFVNHHYLSMKIHYITEKEPLGTAGALGIIPEGILEDDFLMMNGDVLTNLDFKAFFDGHRNAGTMASISTFVRKVQIQYGVLESNENQRMVKYTEKPELCYNVSMGVYAFKSAVLEYVKPGEYLDVPHLMQKLMNEGRGIHTAPFEGDWIDIGNVGEYSRAQEEFAATPEKFLPQSEGCVEEPR